MLPLGPLDIDKEFSCRALFGKPSNQLNEGKEEELNLISKRISEHTLHPYGPNLYCLKSPVDFVNNLTKPSRTFLTIYPNGQVVIVTHFSVDGNKHHFTDHQPHIDAGLKQIREEDLEALKARPRPAAEQENLAPDQEHQVQERLEQLQREVQAFEFDNTNSKVKKLCELYTRNLQLQKQLLTDDHHQRHEKVSTQLLSHFTTLLSSEYLQTSILKANGKTYLTIQRVNCKKLPILIEDDRFLPTLFEHAQEQFREKKLKMRAMARFVLSSCTANPDRMLEAYLNLLRSPTFSTTDIDNEWLNQFCAECLDSIDSGHLEPAFFFELLGAFIRHDQLSCLNKENTDRCIHRGLQEKESCSVLLNTGWDHLKQALPRLSKQTLSALLRKLSIQENGSVKIFELLEEIGEVHWDVFMEVIGGLQKIPTPVLTKLRTIFDGKQRAYAPERNAFYDDLLLKHEAWVTNHEIWREPLTAIHKHREELTKDQEEERLVERQPAARKKGKKARVTTLTLEDIVSELKGFLKPKANQAANPTNQLKLLSKYLRLNRQLGLEKLKDQLTDQEFACLLRLSMEKHFSLFNELITHYRSTLYSTLSAISAFKNILVSLAEHSLRLPTPLALERLLQLGLRADQTLPNGLTLLRALLTQSKAFESRILPFVKTLLDHDADPNCFYEETTSVHVAVILKWNKVLALLLRYGASTKKSDFMIENVRVFPRDIAAIQVDSTAVDLLEKYNAPYSFGPALYDFQIVTRRNTQTSASPGSVTCSKINNTNKLPRKLRDIAKDFQQFRETLGPLINMEPDAVEEREKAHQKLAAHLRKLAAYPLHLMNQPMLDGLRTLHVLAHVGTPEEIEFLLTNFREIILDVKVGGDAERNYFVGSNSAYCKPATPLDVAVFWGQAANAILLSSHGLSVDAQETAEGGYSRFQKMITQMMISQNLNEFEDEKNKFELYCKIGFDPNSVARYVTLSTSIDATINWAGSTRGATTFEIALLGYLEFKRLPGNGYSESNKDSLLEEKLQIIKRLIQFGANRNFQKNNLTLMRFVILTALMKDYNPRLKIYTDEVNRNFIPLLSHVITLCIDPIVRVDLKKPCYDPEILFSFENTGGKCTTFLREVPKYTPTGVDAQNIERVKRLITILREENYHTVTKTDSGSHNAPDDKQKTLNGLCQAIWDDDLPEFSRLIDEYKGDKNNLLTRPCFQDNSTLSHLILLLRRETLSLKIVKYIVHSEPVNNRGETADDYYRLSTLGLLLADRSMGEKVLEILNALETSQEPG